MINVFFSEAGAGIMKLNRERGRIDTNDKIVALPFYLEQGDIREDFDSQYREDYLLDLLTQNGYVTEISEIEEIKDGIKLAIRNLNWLLEQAEKGEPIRIWNEMTPSAICGFYHLCSLLEPMGIDVQYIEIPRRFHNPNYTVINSSLETSLYDRLDELLDREMTIRYFDVNYYSSIWQYLVNENSPLRAMVNGQMISVPDDMFDFIILKHLEVPKQEVAVIGDIITKDQKRLHDAWIAKRIQRLIDEGKIVVLEDNTYPYERTLIRAD